MILELRRRLREIIGAGLLVTIAVVLFLFQRLPAEIESRRVTHKRQLLDSWHDAVHRHDVDGSIEILKRLDLYLTPAEADSMQETARGVFKEKLSNLRTQFAIAVQDKAWNEAIKAIIKEVLHTSESITGLLTYAILATVIAVVVVMLLGRAAARVGGEAAIAREAEG